MSYLYALNRKIATIPCILNEAAEQLRQIAGDIVDIWGPIPAPMERKAGRYRAHMVILSADRARLHFT